MYFNKCEQCGIEMARKKKSESMRSNWRFCSKKCQSVLVVERNKSRTIKEKIVKRCEGCNVGLILKGIKRNKTKRFCSRACFLSFAHRNLSIERKIKIRKVHSDNAKARGVNHLFTERAREKQRISISGSNHWNWRGGITPENRRRRNLLEYRQWRVRVFERDDFTCQECNKRDGYIEADHIKPWALFPELRLDIKNGRTLCKECHKKTDTYMGRTKHFTVHCNYVI